MQNNKDSHYYAYKNNARETDAASRRRKVTVNLRKEKKDDQMLKRRNINEDEDSMLTSNGKSPISMTLDEIVFGMNSADMRLNFEAVQAARKILSKERNPPIDQIIECGIVPKCVAFLDYTVNPDLQFEAAWALTNIASGTPAQTMAVIHAGAVQKLVNLLPSPSTQVVEQAVWALGNIAGDGSEARDIVFNANVLSDLLRVVNRDTSISLLRNATWLMSNLCRNKNPAAPFDKVKTMIPLLADLLSHKDNQVLTDAAWAISYITDDENLKIQAVIDNGCLPRLVKLLEYSDHRIIVPALRSIGNVVTGNDIQTEAVITAGALKPLKSLLQCPRESIIKEAVWTISNIVAGTAEQIQHAIDAGVFPLIRDILEKGDFRSQKEAAWTVTNVAISGTPDQLAHIISKGLLNPYCNLLAVKDPLTIKVILNGLEHILETSDRVWGRDRMCTLLEENGGLDLLEQLQHHENVDIYKKTLHIINTYFNSEEEEDLAPIDNNGILSFGCTDNSGYNF